MTPIFGAIVCECLQQLGYHASQADSAAAALRVCEQLEGKIDLVITDLVMAGKSGNELANELAERHPGIRVLFMSGYSEDSAARQEILMRNSPFLQKPFSVADLAKAVQDALATKLCPFDFDPQSFQHRCSRPADNRTMTHRGRAVTIAVGFRIKFLDRRSKGRAHYGPADTQQSLRRCKASTIRRERPAWS